MKFGKERESDGETVEMKRRKRGRLRERGKSRRVRGRQREKKGRERKGGGGRREKGE